MGKPPIYFAGRTPFSAAPTTKRSRTQASDHPLVAAHTQQSPFMTLQTDHKNAPAKSSSGHGADPHQKP
ncbi:hypothetical protein RvY_01842 [Ramazzottius varieornatus]|uniref:Uncharacterized protein n=1 Tax=Ramazzottius varieornatus TaxID=947166 RepID=A0A1D1UHW2_RAMVA|nr:hypothetical protein RvY_01842 [Ramazzottius varieornatus]